MPDWAQILKDQHAAAHSDDGYLLATQPGVSSDQLDEMADQLGIDLPEEFRELYSTSNGFGVATAQDPSEAFWLFRPLQQLPEFIDSVRSGFEATHPEAAARFFPFIDWGDGDSMGYQTETAGILLPGLFCFEHESYQHTADQAPEDFLASFPVTIEEFLRSASA